MEASISGERVSGLMVEVMLVLSRGSRWLSTVLCYSPKALHDRLRWLRDRQGAGQPLTDAERGEAKGLVDISELLTLLRLRAPMLARFIQLGLTGIYKDHFSNKS
jgi:hypothetical protein